METAIERPGTNTPELYSDFVKQRHLPGWRRRLAARTDKRYQQTEHSLPHCREPAARCGQGHRHRPQKQAQVFVSVALKDPLRTGFASLSEV